MTRAALFEAMRPHAPDQRFSPADVTVIDMLADKWGLPREAMHRLTDATAFFNAVRKITGKLDDTQVRIINDLLASASHWPASWLAYGLATAWHEARLRPIEEIGKGRGLKYGVIGKHGQVAYGRGLVQLTWDWNYERADRELDLGGKLLANYALALDPEIAVRILVSGMEGGWFSGKKLGDYLTAGKGSREQFSAARKIINGIDRADMIAGYAVAFQDALTAGGWS